MLQSAMSEQGKKHETTVRKATFFVLFEPVDTNRFKSYSCSTATAIVSQKRLFSF